MQRQKPDSFKLFFLLFQVMHVIGLQCWNSNPQEMVDYNPPKLVKHVCIYSIKLRGGIRNSIKLKRNKILQLFIFFPFNISYDTCIFYYQWVEQWKKKTKTNSYLFTSPSRWKVLSNFVYSFLKMRRSNLKTVLL